MHHLPPVREVYPEIVRAATRTRLERRVRVLLEFHPAEAALGHERALDAVLEAERDGDALHVRVPALAAEDADLEGDERSAVLRVQAAQRGLVLLDLGDDGHGERRGKRGEGRAVRDGDEQDVPPAGDLGDVRVGGRTGGDDGPLGQRGVAFGADGD